MLQPLSSVITQKKSATWDESDARHFIQAWLRRQLHTERVFCVGFASGVATIQATSPAVRQMAHLLEFELKEVILEAGGPVLSAIKITRS